MLELLGATAKRDTGYCIVPDLEECRVLGVHESFF